MKSISKTVKKKLNEADEYNTRLLGDIDDIDENTYGYKWCIKNADDPSQQIVLYSDYDEETGKATPFAIVRTYGDDYYRIKPEVYDFLKERDDYANLRFEGVYYLCELSKKFYDAYDAGYIYDLEYENGNIHEF